MNLDVKTRYQYYDIPSFSQIQLRHRKNRFIRKELQDKYGQCMITGWNNPTEYECAHIVPRAIGQKLGMSNVNMTSNCILLCNGMHALFDSMQWTMDIYQFLDMEITDEHTFKTKIISYKLSAYKNTDARTGILDEYTDIQLDIPIANYASLFLHYHAYYRYNYENKRDLGDIYDDLLKTEIYRKIRNFSKTSEFRQFLLELRDSYKEAEFHPITAVVNHQNIKTESWSEIVWEYWSPEYKSWKKTDWITGISDPLN